MHSASERRIREKRNGTSPSTTAVPSVRLSGSDTIFHLACRLIRKSQCQNALGGSPCLKIGYLVGQHACLSRSGSGYHKRRPVCIDNCFRADFQFNCFRYSSTYLVFLGIQRYEFLFTVLPQVTVLRCYVCHYPYSFFGLPSV